jgi:hypothetical protein
MLVSRKTIHGATLLLLTTLWTSCTKKDSDESDSSTVSEEKELVTSAETVEDLKLSGSLVIELPDSLESASTEGGALRLTANKRSSEACMVGQTVKDVTKQIASSASLLCHLEAEADKIKFGTKYSIMNGESEFARVWADNRKAADGEITLYVCQGPRDENNQPTDGEMFLSQKIHITGLTENGAKGTVQEVYEQTTQSSKTSMEFDANVTTDGVITITAEQTHADSANDGSFRRSVQLNLVEDGVSDISLASSGTWGGNAFSERALGRFNGDMGHTLFENSGMHESMEFSWTHASFFDAEGLVLSDIESYDEFAEDGALFIDKANLPDFLDDDFSPDEPEGWDCEVEETVELDPDSAAHQECEIEHGEFANCWGTEFQNGEDVAQ